MPPPEVRDELPLNRLNGFGDAVLAVTVAILVLELRHQPSYAYYAATVIGYFVQIAGIALCLAIARVALLTSHPLNHLVRRPA